MPRALAFLASTGCLLIASCSLWPGHGHHRGHRHRVAAGPPRLILQITVDQLRGDLPFRYAHRFGEGGFRYLLDRGAWYTDARYRHANTETAPGHATLATGADPAVHGIVANDWIDRQSGAFVYNTEDERHHLIGQDPKPHQGVSPRNLLATTFGDELFLHTNGRARVFGVSGKDRGAILPAGHAGKAFWLSRRSGGFVTSTYYYESLPAWVDAWNDPSPAARWAGASWELLHDESTYLFAGQDDQPWEVALPAFGRTFPHAYGEGRATPLFVSLSPASDELTGEFAKAVIDNEGLGQDTAPDFLAVSFSATDYAGHLFGPGSLESEDTILRLDRVLADLFAHVDATVGLEHTLIVLSADHGGVEAPEQAAAIGIDAGRVPLDVFRSPNPVAEALRQRYGRDDLVVGPSHPYLYLDVAKIEEAGLDLAEVEQVVAEEAVKIDGIQQAFPASALEEGTEASPEMVELVRRNHHPDRSGQVHLVQHPYWFFHSTEEAGKMGMPFLASIHGSPWAYDRHVPVVFAGNGIRGRRIARPVGPHEIAPTLAAYLGVKPPSGSEGTLLFEVLPRRFEVRPRR